MKKVPSGPAAARTHRGNTRTFSLSPRHSYSWNMLVLVAAIDARRFLDQAFGPRASASITVDTVTPERAPFRRRALSAIHSFSDVHRSHVTLYEELGVTGGRSEHRHRGGGGVIMRFECRAGVRKSEHCCHARWSVKGRSFLGMLRVIGGGSNIARSQNGDVGRSR